MRRLKQSCLVGRLHAVSPKREQHHESDGNPGTDRNLSFSPALHCWADFSSNTLKLFRVLKV